MLEKLDQSILRFEAEGFSLHDDLRGLLSVASVAAAEATVFYSARILEALALEALNRTGISPSRIVLNNLYQLEQLNLIQLSTRYWAHALRRLGNDVRHVNRRVTSADGELAIGLTERWVEWFFCDFPLGTRLETLTVDGQPLRLHSATHLRETMEILDGGAVNLTEFFERSRREKDALFLDAPVLTAVLAEKLIDAKALDEARDVLSKALSDFPRDLRLRQLMGLCLSRSGDLEGAIQMLTPVLKEAPEDPEGAGILSGVYKRRWLESGNRDDLAKAHTTYMAGWHRSRDTSSYLGINAAATAAWLGVTRESRSVAADCRRLLEERREAMKRWPNAPADLSTWDKLTLAEAQLLCGALADARSSYCEIVAAAGGMTGGIEVAIKQLATNLAAMKLPLTAEEFLAPKVKATEGPEIVVGVTGHRTLPDPAQIEAQIREYLLSLRRVPPGEDAPRVVALSALAEGADRIVARCVLDLHPSSTLRVVLPLESADYITDFPSEASQADFQALLARADHVEVLNPPEDKPAWQDRCEAYESAGRYVVDQCDLLIAVWDGKPARGRGGTAEIVDYAVRTGRPLKQFPPC